LRNPETAQVDTVAPATTVSHALYPVSQHLKTNLLLELLKNTDTESVLVFTRTKHRAKRLGQALEKKGYRAASLQGNLSQSRRQSALNGFRDGSHQILVATDIAARGIDVSQVSHVINFDIPDTAEAYIHRIGRTGRAARTGDAFTMVTNDDKAMVSTIERTLGNTLERRKLEGFDYAKPVPERQLRPARSARKPARKQIKTADKAKALKP
jgi:ATP-dependent RNA helicase RhlE